MDQPITAAPATEPVPRDAILPAASYRAPVNTAERRLSVLWQKALNVDRVGLDDDFFALGGDSFAATAIFAELHRLTGRKLPPSMLVDAPTVAELALAVEQDPRTFADRILVPFRTTGEQAPLVVIHGFDGQVLFVRRLAWHLPPHRPLYGVQARGLDGVTAPHASVPEMADEYAARILEALGPRRIHVAGICYGAVLALEVSKRLTQAGADVPMRLLIDPPVKPRSETIEYRGASRRALLQERADGFERMFDDLRRTRPQDAAYYSPGGEGFERAMRVSEALAVAYGRFVPPPTFAPSTIIWSDERARRLKLPPHKYPLTLGPTRATVVRNEKTRITHKMLLRQTVGMIAKVLERAMGVEGEDGGDRKRIDTAAAAAP